MTLMGASEMILVNGVKANTISCNDRAFQYGDGLFETIPFKNRTLMLWEQHMQRLQRGCKIMQIPFIDVAILKEESMAMCDDASAIGVNEGVLKIIISRGESCRGYSPGKSSKPNRVIFCAIFPSHISSVRQDGLATDLCKQALTKNFFADGIKHLNRLDQVMLSLESEKKKLLEAVVTDGSGNVIEGVKSNIFIVKHDEIITPKIANYGVRGVMRDFIIDICQKNSIKVSQRAVSVDELNHVDGLFFCNSVIGIWPVNKLGEETKKIGEITRLLQSQITDYIV